MILLHIALGIAVIVLNLAVVVLGLVLGRRGPQVRTLAGWAQAALAVQVASGFFLLTSTGEGPPVWHYLLPVGALAILFAARAAAGAREGRALGAASLIATAAGGFAYLTGVLHG